MKTLQMNRKHIAVFDFDGTLTHDDTFISFSRFALGSTRLIIGILRGLPWLISWKLGLINSSRAKEKLYSFMYKGIPKNKIMRKSRDFTPNYQKDTLMLLKKHKEDGDIVYIISASLDLWLYEIAQKLGVKVLCTTTSVNESGELNGRFSSANCIDEEKVRRLKAEEKGDFYLTAYGDEPTGGDASLFKIADKFIVISR